MSHPENQTRIELEGGKYTVCHTNGADFHALRHGAQWRDLTGDGLVLAAAQDERKTFEVEIPDISAIYDGRSFIPYRSLEAGERLMTVAQHLRIEKQLRAALTHPAQTEQQPVSWQFYQDGKWWNGDDRIKDHRKNTEAAGIQVRDLYPSPIAQTANCTNEDSWNCKYCRKTETCDALKDERNFGTPQVAMIPTGWKLVPVNPTEAMLDEIALTEHFSRKALAARYAALLDAAPTQEIPQ